MTPTLQMSAVALYLSTRRDDGSEQQQEHGENTSVSHSSRGQKTRAVNTRGHKTSGYHIDCIDGRAKGSGHVRARDKGVSDIK